MARVRRQATDALPLRVLVADDDEDVRHALKAVLDAVAGVELVGAARDGFEAVRLFSELRPDAVLTDVVMPGCDGIEATKQILAIEPAARVIVFTGSEDSRMLALCLAAGAKGCLRKGADTIALVPLMLALATPATSSPPGSGGSSTDGRHPMGGDAHTPDARQRLPPPSPSRSASRSPAPARAPASSA